MHATPPCIESSCSKQQPTSTPATGDFSPCQLAPNGHPTLNLHQSCNSQQERWGRSFPNQAKSSHHPPSKSPPSGLPKGGIHPSSTLTIF
ncbi:hypothetical protein V6N13_048691 [Hibiscus sabdariffa]|uniref:Uncharacterized protein n=1 Tax=Hibiscus sabdariffa TaxID=183260 RepID=A0ABR2DIT4_9ROSI